MSIKSILYSCVVCLIVLVSLFSCVQQDRIPAPGPASNKGDSLMVSTNSLNFKGWIDTLEIEITSTSAWRAYTLNAPWCEPLQRTGVGGGKVKVAVSENKEQGLRTATLYVSNDFGNVCKVQIRQSTTFGTQIIPSALSFGSWSQTLSVQLISDTNRIETLYAVASHDWISVVKFPDKDCFEITVSANTELISRSGSVHFQNAGQQFSMEVQITQDGLTERDLLMELYNEMDGEKWTHKYNWNSTQNISDWYGVTTNADGFVTAISLPKNNLTGTLPESITKLKELTSLDLSGNSVEIDYMSKDFPKLESLVVHDNIASVNIDYIMKQYTLKTLNLSGCGVGGEFPTYFVKGLLNLDLSYCAMEGEIPSSIMNMSSLQILNLSGNRPTEIPSTIGALKMLKELHLHDTRIKSLPATIGEMTSLRQLVVTGNRLTALPPELSNLHSLMIISASGNQITTIDQDVIMAPNLMALSLNNNKITGELPTYLTLAKNLYSLSLFGNRLSGTIDESIKNSRWFSRWRDQCRLCDQYGVGFTNCDN